MLNVLTYERVIYHINAKDLDIVLEQSKPIAFCNVAKSVIYIVFRVPVAQQEKFNLYEILAIPKVSSSDS